MSNICPCTMGNSVSKALFNLKNARKQNSNEPEQTSPATVLSRTVRRSNAVTMYQESPWLYLVTFRLESGEELELQTSEEVYAKLKEGTAGSLAWQGERLVSFP